MESPTGHNRGQPAPLYAAFLVRCRHSASHWYYSLENVATREKQRFDSLATLVLYVQGFLKEVSETREETESAARDEGRS